MAKYLDEPGLIHFMTLIKTAIANVSTTLIARTHRHTIGSSTGSAASVTAGTAASLSTTTKTFVTSASKLTMGTAKSIKPITKKTVVTGGSKTSIPNISVGTATTDTVKGVDTFTANTPTAVTPATVVKTHTAMSAVPSSSSPYILVITKDSATTGASATVTAGTAASLTTTNKTFTTDATKATAGTAIDAYTSLTTGDSVTEGTAISVPQFTVADAPTGTVKGVDTFTANTPTAVDPANVVTSVDAHTGYASI